MSNKHEGLIRVNGVWMTKEGLAQRNARMMERNIFEAMRGNLPFTGDDKAWSTNCGGIPIIREGRQRHSSSTGDWAAYMDKI